MLTKCRSLPTLFSIKHVVTANNDFAVIMQLREALTCAGSVVFKQSHFNSAYYIYGPAERQTN